MTLQELNEMVGKSKMDYELIFLVDNQYHRNIDEIFDVDSEKELIILQSEE